MKKLLLKLYNAIGNYLGIEKEWYKLDVKETKDFQIVTFVSRHELDTVEKTTIFAKSVGFESMPFDIAVRDHPGGSIKHRLQKTHSVGEIEGRVLKDHYEKMYKEAGGKVTKMVVEGDPASTIKCQTVIVKPNK